VPWGIQKIYKKRGRFWGAIAACTGGRRSKPIMISTKTGGTNETPDYHPYVEFFYRRRLRTKHHRKEDVFGKRCGQLDRSEGAQHEYGRRERRRGRHLGPVYLSRCESYPKCSATIQHLPGSLFSKCGRRGTTSVPGWKCIDGQSHGRRRLHRSCANVEQLH